MASRNYKYYQPNEKDLKDNYGDCVIRALTKVMSKTWTQVFDDLMAKYTEKNDLVKVKTTNMGSLFKLTYDVKLKDPAKEKEFIDELRCRNGNLEISCGLPAVRKQEDVL